MTKREGFTFLYYLLCDLNLPNWKKKESIFFLLLMDCTLQNVVYGFYSNDLMGKDALEYGRWYHITWTWTKANGMRWDRCSMLTL